MLKLVGVMAIVFGMAGAIFEWYQARARMINFIDDFGGFLAEGQRQTIENKKTTIEYFACYKGKNSVINNCSRDIAVKLSQHYMPTGGEIWKHCWELHTEDIALTGEGRKLLLEAGDAFFGKTTTECKYWFELYERRFQELYEREKGRSNEQKKIVVPVGAFIGMMLIVMLI